MRFQNELVWSGVNDTKMLVWTKIFCYVFGQMKTKTFTKKSISVEGLIKSSVWSQKNKNFIFDSGFQMSVVKPKSKLSLWTITTETNNAMNQSEFEANTSSQRGRGGDCECKTKGNANCFRLSTENRFKKKKRFLPLLCDSPQKLVLVVPGCPLAFPGQ